MEEDPSARDAQTAARSVEFSASPRFSFALTNSRLSNCESNSLTIASVRPDFPTRTEIFSSWLFAALVILAGILLIFWPPFCWLVIGHTSLVEGVCSESGFVVLLWSGPQRLMRPHLRHVMIVTLPRTRTRQVTDGRSAFWQSLQIHERRPLGNPRRWRRERLMISRAALLSNSGEFVDGLARIDSNCWREAVARTRRC